MQLSALEELRSELKAIRELHYTGDRLSRVGALSQWAVERVLFLWSGTVATLR